MRRSSLVGLGLSATAALGAGHACGGTKVPNPGAEGGLGGEQGNAGGQSAPLPALHGAPLVFSPTADSFGVNVVVGTGSPDHLRLAIRPQGSDSWRRLGKKPRHPAQDVAEWTAEGLEAGTRYEYAVFLSSASDPGASDQEGGAGNVLEHNIVYQGSAVTQRKPGESFEFALITDSHISPRSVAPGTLSAYEYQESILLGLAPEIQNAQPDFIVNLGDMLDFHLFGFNEPPPDGSWTRLAYLNYRRCLRDALGHAAHFPVIGNWDGENGSYAEDQIAYSREQRLAYVPAPEPETYPQGGSPHEDYYAYTWGDALFVALNVMTYTEKELLLDDPGDGSPEDWTLGEQQLAWLETTLESSQSKWKFLLIHHAVGGAGGDEENAIYGRGGGLAANVGEQARVHDLMVQHDAQIFFYGHDHVFTDMVVDDIHYTLPGSAGAPWKFDESETGYEQQWLDSGYARVQVSPTEVTVRFLAYGGEELLSYSLE